MLRTKLILEKFDKEHRLLEKKEKWSRSFLIQFIELLYVAHANIDEGAPYAMDDVGGNSRDIDFKSGAARYAKGHLRTGSPAGSGGCFVFDGYYNTPSLISRDMIEASLIGIQIGTSNTPVTPADYVMGTRILHGSGAGEMEYGGTELLSLVIANPNGQFTIRRYFTNNSGGGITVEETGINSGASEYNIGSWPFCIARDVTGGIVVANTEILRVTYVPQITV